MAGDRGFFDLKKQFVFYASYHNQPINVLIHLFCIWNLGKTIICIFLNTFYDDCTLAWQYYDGSIQSIIDVVNNVVVVM